MNKNKERKGARYTRLLVLSVVSELLRALSHRRKVMPISNNPV
jgi:hypothetical protein